MPSLADSAVIFILALMLFGPKKLPQLARQLGKLMAEFRRASNEFRMQMEDELRMEEQKEHQAKVEAMAGPPSTPPEQDFVPPAPDDHAPDGSPLAEATEPVHLPAAPIAESGGLKMMPPSTGLPVESAAHGTSTEPDEPVVVHDIPEHSILPPQHVGISSEEPAESTHHA